MSNHPGWIGVDFDGTLAVYDGWKGAIHVGEPIWPMVNRVRKWLKDGAEVRIVTARASDPVACTVIYNFCETYIGQRLPVTATKDYQMIELWDDRCVQVIPNTGQRADGKA